MNKKQITTIFIVLAIIAVIATGTFAWISFITKNTALVLTVGEIDGLSVTLKPYQVDATLSPVNSYEDGIYADVTANNKLPESETFSLYYNIDSIDEALKTTDFKYKILKSSDNFVTSQTVKEGDFSSAVAGQKMNIYEEEILGNNTTYKYKVYIWIQNQEYDQTTLEDTEFSGELRASIDKCYNPTTAPVLDSGMIPVTIASDGTVTAVSKNSDDWYNYCGKKWANAVLVKETADAEAGSHGRSYYKTNSENGNNVTVTESDILAYYVWIPRYSYKIWTLGVSATGQEQKIDIKFVDKNMKDNGTQIGEYYTHPAFTFGTQELDGIWVGKFEMSHNTLSSTTTKNNLSCTSTTCTNASGLRILPNVVSLRLNNISNIWHASRSMEQSNNVFGISNSDSHVMKNSEWGAAAYLSHSKYGINAEIRIDNNNAFTTGCGAATANASSSANCDNRYGTVTSYPQSTTGNISGIFDMSGGTWEYVMGNYGNNTGYSGFTADWFINNSKYYDLYDSSIFTGDSSTNYSFCSLSTCGGHALNETKNWYSDPAEFVLSSDPWFSCGGGHGSTSDAGAFGKTSNGGGSSNFSWRGVLVERGA